MNQKLLYGPFTQVVTMNNLPARGAISDDQLEVIADGGILVLGDLILAIDSYRSLLNSADKIMEVREGAVALPGFIDSHTHICFGGTRAKDYAMRNAGKTYLEIAAAGGGIWDSVLATRACDQSELSAGILARSQRHMQAGVTTIEVKSGYGLTPEEELKMLRAIKNADDATEADLIPTCLAAHVKPKDFEGTHEEYLNHLVTTLFPAIKSESLTSRIDIFVEEGAFGVSVAEPYLQKARDFGFDITVHADQFHTGGSDLAVKMKAKSADHLEASGSDEIAQLAKSDVIATALPGASLGLGCDFTPARKILDQGGRLAIASDWNPGSAPMGDLLMQATILGTFQKLSNAEVLAGITIRGAQALGLEDRGILAEGKKADFITFSTDDFNEILYQQGKLTPNQVIKNGKPINS